MVGFSPNPAQASRFPSGDHAWHVRFKVKPGSSRLYPDPSGLTVAVRGPPGRPVTVTAILVPSGDHLGLSAPPGRSLRSPVPSGLIVNIWESSRAGFHRPKAILPFAGALPAPACPPTAMSPSKLII